MVGTTLAVALEIVTPENLHFWKIITLAIATLSLSSPLPITPVVLSILG